MFFPNPPFLLPFPHVKAPTHPHRALPKSHDHSSAFLNPQSSSYTLPTSQVPFPPFLSSCSLPSTALPFPSPFLPSSCSLPFPYLTLNPPPTPYPSPHPHPSQQQSSSRASPSQFWCCKLSFPSRKCLYLKRAKLIGCSTCLSQTCVFP